MLFCYNHSLIHLYSFPSWLRFCLPDGSDLFLCQSHTTAACMPAVQRAKELHPDVSGHSISVDDFLQLVAAYEVLSDPEQRQLYDVSRDQQLPNFMRQAAQATAKAADIHSSQSGTQLLCCIHSHCYAYQPECVPPNL